MPFSLRHHVWFLVERLEAQEAQRASEERLRIALEATEDRSTFKEAFASAARQAYSPSWLRQSEELFRLMADAVPSQHSSNS